LEMRLLVSANARLCFVPLLLLLFLGLCRLPVSAHCTGHGKNQVCVSTNSIKLTLPSSGDPDPLPLTITGSKPITHMVNIQPIITGTTSMSETATHFGTSSQQAVIEDLIDQIWAQVGVDINWLTPVTYFSDFSYQGNPGNNNPRPTTDLNIMVLGDPSAPLHTDPTVLNMFFTNITPGFSAGSNLSVSGLAFVDDNGSAITVGDLLPTFLNGQEAVAAVTAHEIGHNLGLPHIVESFNLMQDGNAAPSTLGENLSAAQEATIFTDDPLFLDGFDFLIPIPEPTTALSLMAAFVLFAGTRRRS
ncbi:MAG: PEP-CTERM sorting domain-containing protein, partial [Verrucomicrobiota bacterium]